MPIHRFSSKECIKYACPNRTADILPLLICSLTHSGLCLRMTATSRTVNNLTWRPYPKPTLAFVYAGRYLLLDRPRNQPPLPRCVISPPVSNHTTKKRLCQALFCHFRDIFSFSQRFRGFTSNVEGVISGSLPANRDILAGLLSGSAGCQVFLLKNVTWGTIGGTIDSHTKANLLRDFYSTLSVARRTIVNRTKERKPFWFLFEGTYVHEDAPCLSPYAQHTGVGTLGGYLCLREHA